jgi:hypothetical protein
MSNSVMCWTSHSTAVSLSEELYARETKRDRERVIESLIRFEGRVLGMLRYLFTVSLPKIFFRSQYSILLQSEKISSYLNVVWIKLIPSALQILDCISILKEY